MKTIISLVAFAIVSLSAFAGVDQTLKGKNYFDNGVRSLNYLYGEVAYLNYDKGKRQRIGLVKRWFKHPLTEVDCKTPRSNWIVIDIQNEQGEYGLMTRQMLKDLDTRDLTAADALHISKRFRFITDKDTGRVIPTMINRRTAPIFCELKEKGERRWNAMWSHF